MTPNEIKGKLFALYYMQEVFSWDTASSLWPVGPNVIRSISIGEKDSYLQLRDISALTDDEKEMIATAMQWYPEDVIDWINGICGSSDFDNLYDWGRLQDILRSIGVLLPFTYLDENNKPVTLTPTDILNRGWVK